MKAFKMIIFRVRVTLEVIPKSFKILNKKIE